MRYLVFGAGVFGKSVSVKLVELGAEVFLIDHNEEALECVRDQVTGVLVAESTDKDTVREIVERKKSDGAFICFGDSFDASLLVVIYLKEFGIEQIIARASNQMQADILNRLGIDQVILPEIMMGEMMGEYIIIGESEQLKIDREISIIRVKLPKSASGKKLSELEAKKMGIEVLFVHRIYLSPRVTKLIKPEEDPKLEDGDNLVLMGLPRRIVKFIEHTRRELRIES